MNTALRTRLAPLARRCFTTGRALRQDQVHPSYQKIKDTQKFYQADVGTFVPVRIISLKFAVLKSVPVLVVNLLR